MRQVKLKSHYDLVIVGGGIQGCAMLWEAQSRGLNSLLIEADDYCSQTSANSLKMIHGGIRYLQTLDFSRTIRSAREQETLIKIAPDLIKPLPCLLPTQSKLNRSRLAVTVGFALYNMIKAISSSSKRLPKARWIGKDELNEHARIVNNQTVTGAGFWYDAQVQNAQGLGLAFIRTARNSGADAFNYLKAENFSVINENQFQLGLVCQLNGQEFQATAGNLIFCTAAQTAETISALNIGNQKYPDFCLALNLVANYRYAEVAIGLQSGFAQQASNTPKRLLFAAPWQDKTLFGTWYFDAAGESGLQQVPTDAQIQLCLDEVNATYPQTSLNIDDLHQVQHGLLPVRDNHPDASLDLLETDLIIKPNQQLNLFAVIPTKYTTCRAVAEQTINKLSENSQLDISQSISADTLLLDTDT